MEKESAIEGAVECFISYYETEYQSEIPPVYKMVLRCRCSLGELLENEIDFFERTGGLKDNPYSILDSPAYSLHREIVLNTLEERLEHRQALEAFERDSYEHDKHDPKTQVKVWLHVRKMRELQSLANDIRAARPVTPPIETATVLIGTATDIADSELPEPKAKEKPEGKTVPSIDAVHIVEHIKRIDGYQEPPSLTLTDLKPPSEENGRWFSGDQTKKILNDIQKLKKKQLLVKSALRTRRQNVTRIQDEQTGYWHGKDTEGVFFRHKKKNETPEYFILCTKDSHFSKEYPKLVDSASDLPPLEAKLLKKITK